MIDTNGVIEVAADFENAECRDSDFLISGLRDFEAKSDMALTCEVVEFCRTNTIKDAAKCSGIREITVVKVNMRGMFEESVNVGCFSNNSVNLIAFFEEELSEISSILARDSSDKRNFG